MHYLGERRLSVGEVAFLLGFAEPSSFHKAFKRWTGTSPMDYRRAGRR
jgi:AraC-like DNA-binding protein